MNSLILPIASASSIQHIDGKTFIIGDDSPYLLVATGTNFEHCEQVQIINRPERRIPKPEKPDFESSVVIEEEGKLHLLLIGSASTPVREQLVLLPVDEPKRFTSFSSKVFFDRLKKEHGFNEVNIEASVALPGTHILILADRGHQGNRSNRLIITDTHFFKQQETAPILVAEITLPQSEFHKGISGFAYIPERDLLLFTATAEDTPNAYDDGDILGSYIGWVEKLRHQLEQPVITPTAFYNLEQYSNIFTTQKIEGLCVQALAPGLQQFTLLLVADNDQGDTSPLYRLEVSIP